MDDNKLTLVTEDGEEVMCEIILTHEHEGKNYVIFEFMDSEEISAAEYVEDADDPSSGTFKDIESEEIWAMLDEVLNKYYDELDDENQE